MLATLLAALGVLLPALPASAHAVLLETKPNSGATLPEAPKTIVLRFNEPVSASLGGVRIFDPKGKRLETEKARHSGNSSTLQMSLPKLRDGAYVVSWRVISADSHPVRAAFTFQVGKEGATGAAGREVTAKLLAGQGGDHAVGVLFGVVRFVAFAALIVLIGGFAFMWLLWASGAASAAARRLLWGAWAAALVATLAGVVLQGPYAAGLPLSEGFKPSLISDVLGTRFGTVWLVRAGLLLLVLPLLVLLRRGGAGLPPVALRLGGATVGIGLLLTPGLAGHASTGDLTGLALLADVVHLAAVALWLGGLAMLSAAVLPRRDLAVMVTVVPRFSRLAFAAVVTIIATGLFQAWRQVRELDALTNTTYGKLLLVKVGAFVAMVALAAVSRRLVHRRLRVREVTAGSTARELQPSLSGPGAMRADPDAETSRRLRKSVMAELAVAVVILSVTAGLVNAVPAREALAKPFTTTLESKDLSIDVTVDPSKAGLNEVHIYTFDPQGVPMGVPELEATLSLPERDLGPLPVKLNSMFQGHWVSDRLDIPLAGQWKLNFTARLSEFDATRLSTTVTIRSRRRP